LKDETEKKNELKKARKKKTNLGESPKPGLIFQIHNPWNLRSMINQEAQFLTNLMLNDEIKKLSI